MKKLMKNAKLTKNVKADEERESRWRCPATMQCGRTNCQVQLSG